MRFEHVAVMSVAHVDAPLRVTSAEMEARLAPAMAAMKLPTKGMIRGLTGIVARRFWNEGTQPSEAATLAGRAALAQAGLSPEHVGALINTSVCRDYVEPSVSCLVHGNLGLDPACLNFDIANACLGFLNGMELVGNMIERGQIDVGLIVDGESSRFAVEQTIARLQQPGANAQSLRDHFATLTLGSGAAAMVLARADLAPQAPRLVGSVTMASSEHNHLCRGQLDHMVTDSQQLLRAGVALAERTFDVARSELQWHPDALDELVLHQVSKTHTQTVARSLGVNTAKMLAIYPEFGNVGPASVPIVLSKAAEAGRVGPGARVALMGIGSGLNCTMAEVRW